MIGPKIVSSVFAVGCLVLIVALAGCEENGTLDLSGYDGPSYNPSEVRSVAIAPDSITLSVGHGTTITAIVTRLRGSAKASRSPPS